MRGPEGGGGDGGFMWMVLAGIGLYLFFQYQQSQTVPTVAGSGGVQIPVPGAVNGPPPQTPTYAASPGMQWQLSPYWPSLPPGSQWVQVPVNTPVSLVTAGGG